MDEQSAFLLVNRRGRIHAIVNRLEWHVRNCWRRSTVVLPAAAILLLIGCATPQYAGLDEQKIFHSDPLVLREGDSVRISFPGAPNLNTVQQIKRDGRISLQLVGEVNAAGLTAGELEKELVKLCGPQLQVKEVTVAVEASSLSIYVTGAVLRPGKVMSERPLTALEAIMEAGGFDYTKANQKAVAVIRHEGSTTQRYKLNLKNELSGREVEPFALKSFDIIYVPEKFAWF
jgi:polysaccharide export outer membrane protein